MAEIRVEHVTKIFQRNIVAVHDVSLEVRDGEFLVLVGPSGCGKSTLLRLLAGLEEATLGRIFIGDREVSDLPAKQRDVAMVFQNYALYPHMSVERNLSFGLRLRKMPKAEIRKRVDHISRVLGLEELLERKPGQLSGGQRQRVAMGRAMVREPQAFLMDEPLSNLDAKLRVTMRSELARLHERLHTTTVYVTHDQVEAMTLGHRVAVMRDGLIQQIDTPQGLFGRPRNLFVAGFIGSPSMNFVRAQIDDDAISFAQFRVPTPPEVAALAGREVVLGIRPSFFEDDAIAHPSLPRIDVDAQVVEELGIEALVLFSLDAMPVTDAQPTTEQRQEDEETRLMHDDASLIFTARIDARTRIRSGERARLAVDPGRFHFFDPSSGQAIRLGSTAPVETTTGAS